MIATDDGKWFHCFLSEQNGCTGKFLDSGHAGVEWALRHLIGFHPAAVFGLMMLQYHVLAGNKAFRLIGRSGLVLQIYRWRTPHGDPFLLSLLLIFLDCYVLNLLGRIKCVFGGNTGMGCIYRLGFCRDQFGRYHGGMIMQETNFELTFIGAEEDEEQRQHMRMVSEPHASRIVLGDKPIHNCYMDVTNNPLRVALTFIIQVCLVLCYIWTMNRQTVAMNYPWDDIKDNGKENMFNCSKWALAVLITLIVGDGEMGEVFDGSFWDKVTKNSDRPDLARYRFECNVRRFLDKTVNEGFRSLLMSTAPIMLCSVSPMDFIMDCLAIFFILKIDDYDSPKGESELWNHYVSYRTGPGRDAAVQFFFKACGWTWKQPPAVWAPVPTEITGATSESTDVVRLDGRSLSLP
jgi:hypothetical protein